MSEYVDCETEFKDESELIETLVDMGVAREHIEVHESAVPLNGYGGTERQQRGNIIIRKGHVGASSNDIGFQKDENGVYRAWISDYDRHRGLGQKIFSGGLKQHYAKRVILKQAGRVHGHKVTTCEDKDGKIRIRIKAK